MFQIETALLKFDEVSDTSAKTSVVKRQLYSYVNVVLIPDIHSPDYSMAKYASV